MKKTALFSVSDKTGLLPFAQALKSLGWDILASAGTAKFLKENGVECNDVAVIVGKPILGHRVVTLSREIHAGLLATDSAEDQSELALMGIPRIDLVYVTFYPLLEETQRPEATLQSVIEKTDIGGPTMIRSAVKGRRLALTNSGQFDLVLDFLKNENPSDEEREKVLLLLSQIAEMEISNYCRISADFYAKCMSKIPASV